jgi:hypothetical protein
MRVLTILGGRKENKYVYEISIFLELDFVGIMFTLYWKYINKHGNSNWVLYNVNVLYWVVLTW